MVEDRLTDGTRIAQLLASELTGAGDDLADVTVTDADPDVEPDPDGAFAYGVDVGDERIAEVSVQPDRALVEFLVAPDVAAEAGREADLRVRPKAVRPPRTLAFVEDGAQVKWVLPVFERVVEAVADGPADSEAD